VKEILRNPDSFAKIIDLAVSELNVDEIMTRLVDELRDLFGCERCTLYVVDRPAEELYTKVVQSDSLGHFRLPIDKSSIAGFVATTGREVLVDDVREEKELRKIDGELRFNSFIDAHVSPPTKQMMAVPLRMRGTTFGVLQAMNKPGGFLGRDMGTMKEVAPILAMSVHHALAMQKLESHGLHSPL
jgi:GAF domain-containing protein